MATEPIKAGSDNPFAQTVSQAKSMAEDFTRLFSEKRGSAAGIRPTKCNHHCAARLLATRSELISDSFSTQHRSALPM